MGTAAIGGQPAGLSRRSFQARLLALAAVLLVVVALAFFLPPIAQEPDYHRFADRRSLLGIPNLLNVISNASYAVISALGLLFVWRQRVQAAFTDLWERWAFGALFAGVGLTALGSSYYHLAPDNARLFWDRLPMTIAFLSLFVITIAERISEKAARLLLGPLLALGAASVVYWRQGELAGAGDLRFYGLVQYVPWLAIPLMAALFPPRYTRAADLFAAAGWYALAKLGEVFDAQIFALGGAVSGHTLKHLASGVAIYWILRMLRLRRLAGSGEALSGAR